MLPHTSAQSALFFSCPNSVVSPHLAERCIGAATHTGTANQCHRFAARSLGLAGVAARKPLDALYSYYNVIEAYMC